MYALVECKGKQYKVEKGNVLNVDKIEAKEGDVITIDKVLLLSDEGKVKVGSPFVKGASVKAKVEGEVRGKKVLVFKYKPKKDYHRFLGHKEKYTRIKIEDISL